MRCWDGVLTCDSAAPSAGWSSSGLGPEEQEGLWVAATWWSGSRDPQRRYGRGCRSEPPSLWDISGQGKKNGQDFIGGLDDTKMTRNYCNKLVIKVFETAVLCMRVCSKWYLMFKY